MLGNNPFYYRTIRRNVVAFGTIFKDITLIRYKKDTYNEINRINVPLKYTGKENFLTRLAENYDLHKPTQINLPVMTFEFTNIEYDASRKLSPYLSNFNATSSSSANKQYMGVPYNMDFELNIYVRNVEDGTQIVEQILPYFNPDYTLSMSFVDQMNVVRDIPIILEKIDYNPDYEGSADEKVRTLVWTLSFKMKTYFFGPIDSGKLITQATANTFTYNDTTDGVYNITLNQPFGVFQLGEVVYQGKNVPEATTTATVVEYDTASNILIVTNRQGKDWDPSANIKGRDSGASGAIGGLIIPQNILKVQELIVTPNPANANGSGDFGFTDNLIEWPNIGS